MTRRLRARRRYAVVPSEPQTTTLIRAEILAFIRHH
jgi:hypothetical protein